MASLLEALRQRMANQQAPAVQPQQQAVSNVLAAKSGTAGTGGGIKGSQQTTQAAVDTANAGLHHSQQAGRVQATQLVTTEGQQTADFQQKQTALDTNKAVAENQLGSAAQTARADLQTKRDLATSDRDFKASQQIENVNNKAKSALAQLLAEKNITVNNMFADADREKKELEFRKDSAALEQRAFLLAMSDKSYMEQIRRVGEEQGLRRKAKYREEATRLVWGDNLDRLIKKIGFDEKMNQQGRDWKIELANMGFSQRMDLAKAAIQDESRRQMWTGIGNTAAAGADAWVEYDKKKG